MDRRTLLTMSTAACLCGVYEAYALFVSPMFSPRDKRAASREETDTPRVEEPPRRALVPSPGSCVLLCSNDEATDRAALN